MECLRDYIGVLGCGASGSLGNRYINSLPGISLESIEALANDEQKTFLGVWNDVQKRALAKFQIEINERFAKRYKLKQIRSSLNLLKKIDTSVVIPADVKKRGFSAELTTVNSYFVASNLQYHYVESLSIYVIDKTEIDPNPITVYVVDLDTEEVLSTFTLSNTEYDNGWNEIRVNQCYEASRLGFVYDATLIKSPFQNLNTLIANGYYSQVSAVYGAYCNPFLRGLEYVTADAPVFGNNMFGLTGIIGVRCKYDNIVCSNRDAFVYSLWYLMGTEMMIERMNSDRLNPFTGLDVDKAASLYKDFMAEFTRSIDQVVNSTDLDLSDACIECNDQVQFTESRL